MDLSLIEQTEAICLLFASVKNLLNEFDLDMHDQGYDPLSSPFEESKKIRINNHKLLKFSTEIETALEKIKQGKKGNR